MTLIVSSTSQRAAESGHWYDRKGGTQYRIVGTNGKERATTIRDARKYGWVPSVTTVIRAAAKPGLERWKAEQLLMAALTLPRLPAETDDQWIDRVWQDSVAQTIKAAERGTEIHAAVEAYFCGRNYPDAMQPYVTAVLEAIDQLGAQVWNPEKSFASPLGYGGKVDIHSDAVVLDFKTKDGDLDGLKSYDEHFMQVAAYAHGLGRQSARTGIVFVGRELQLQLDGTFKARARLLMHSTEERDHGWLMFKALLAYWQEANEYAPTWREG